MRETTDEWKVRTIGGGAAGFCDIGSIDADVIQDLVEEFWPDGGEKMWQSMARNQYLSIWNDPKKGAATGQSDLPTGGTEEERLAALEKQVDQSLDALQKEVEGSIGSLATKLDALLAKAG